MVADYGIQAEHWLFSSDPKWAKTPIASFCSNAQPTVRLWFDSSICHDVPVAASSSLTVATAVPCNSFKCPVKSSSPRSWRIYCSSKTYSGSPRFLGRRWKLCSATLPWWTLLGHGWSWAWGRGRRRCASGCQSMRPCFAPSQRRIQGPSTATWDAWTVWFPSNIRGTAATEAIIWNPCLGTSELDQWNHSFGSCGKNAPPRKDPPTQIFVLQLLWKCWEVKLRPCEKGNLWRSLLWMPLIVTGWWLLKSVLLCLTNVKRSTKHRYLVGGFVDYDYLVCIFLIFIDHGWPWFIKSEADIIFEYYIYVYYLIYIYIYIFLIYIYIFIL